ncbi:hypothetical protein [Thermomonas sp.]|jgi:hypothetical protein|nr:hypothetical protein [Thermomonas sp.]
MSLENWRGDSIGCNVEKRVIENKNAGFATGITFTLCALAARL